MTKPVLHHANGWGSDGRCWVCGQEWPCDGAVLPEKHDTWSENCKCNTPPVVHEDDSYGDCVTCREYIHHTEDEMRHVAWPCPPHRLAAFARLAETGRVRPRLYLNDAVYHALVYRIFRGHPPESALENEP